MTYKELGEVIKEQINNIQIINKNWVYTENVYTIIANLGLSEYLSKSQNINELDQKIPKEVEENVEKCVRQLKNIVIDIRLYGDNSKYGILYKIVPNIDTIKNVKDLIQSDNGRLIDGLINRIINNNRRVLQISNLNSIMLADRSNLKDLKINDISRSIFDFVIWVLIADLSQTLELYPSIYTSIIDNSINELNGVADKDVIDRLMKDREAKNSYKLIGTRDFVGLHNALLPDYKNIIVPRQPLPDIWPFNNNIVQLVLDKLDWLDISVTKLVKMKLLGLDIQKELNTTLNTSDIIIYYILRKIMQVIKDGGMHNVT